MAERLCCAGVHACVMRQGLTLEICSAEAAFEPLHFTLEEADVPHHVLRRVNLHGNFTWRGRG